ncbi:hypothetical protein FraQA3DRAFT_5737, partial [Frankia sp. QA3]
PDADAPDADSARQAARAGDDA